MSSRLLQNFKGGRAIVVTRRGGWESTLETTLAKLGVSTEYPEIIDGRAQIDVAGLQADRDILFVDGDLEGAVAIEVNPASRLPPVPVIGLVGVEAPSRLKALVNLGATSFLRKPVHGGQQGGLDEEGAYSQLRRESMRARQNMELYCEEFLSKRAKPPDTTGRTTGIMLQGGDKQAI